MCSSKAFQGSLSIFFSIKHRVGDAKLECQLFWSKFPLWTVPESSSKSALAIERASSLVSVSLSLFNYRPLRSTSTKIRGEWVTLKSSIVRRYCQHGRLSAFVYSVVSDTPESAQDQAAEAFDSRTPNQFRFSGRVSNSSSSNFFRQNHFGFSICWCQFVNLFLAFNDLIILAPFCVVRTFKSFSLRLVTDPASQMATSRISLILLISRV